MVCYVVSPILVIFFGALALLIIIVVILALVIPWCIDSLSNRPKKSSGSSGSGAGYRGSSRGIFGKVTSAAVDPLASSSISLRVASAVHDITV